MSKGTKIVVLVALVLLSSSLFEFARAEGHHAATAFLAVTTVGLVVAIAVVALSRDRPRRR